MRREVTEPKDGNPDSAKLFLFTDRDERIIALAKEQAAAFMQTYGKGRKQHMIDLRHYANIYNTNVLNKTGND